MMRRLLLYPLALLALPFAAHAEGDPRLVSRLYDPNAVVRIEGRTGVQATIAFADDEHIENVAIGDSNLWQVTPNKRANYLFLKPLEANAQTNMTVVTDRHTYLFNLVASPKSRPLYVLRFRYPEEPKPATAAAGSGGIDFGQQQQAGEQPVDPASLNFAWRSRGSGRLIPARVYDDGQSTYLSWAIGDPIPAIQTRNEKGAEGPVNFSVRGDVIVVDGVPDLIVLRSGKESATLEYKGPTKTQGEIPSLPPATASATASAKMEL